MSLNYVHIFSQIDKAKKAKKKRKPNPVNPDTGRRADGSIPWGSKLDIENRKRLDEEKKKKEEEIESTGGRVSQRRYRDNPGGKNKPSLHRGTLSDYKMDKKTGKVTGSGSSGVGTPFEDEELEVVGGKAVNTGTTRRAHSRTKLTEEEKRKRADAKASARKLSESQRKQMKRRVPVKIADLAEGGTGKIDVEQQRKQRKQDEKAREAESQLRHDVEESPSGKKQVAGISSEEPEHIKNRNKPTKDKVTEGMTTLTEPGVRVAELRQAKLDDKKEDRRREWKKRQMTDKPEPGAGESSVEYHARQEHIAEMDKKSKKKKPLLPEDKEEEEEFLRKMQNI